MTVVEINAEVFLRLEQELHKPQTRSSRKALNGLLADDFIEFGSSGTVYNKAIIIDALLQETPSDTAALPEVLDFTHADRDWRRFGPISKLAAFKRFYARQADPSQLDLEVC